MREHEATSAVIILRPSLITFAFSILELGTTKIIDHNSLSIVLRLQNTFFVQLVCTTTWENTSNDLSQSVCRM